MSTDTDTECPQSPKTDIGGPRGRPRARRRRRVQYPASVTFRCGAELMDKLDKLADLEGCSLGEIVRMLLDDVVQSELNAARKRARRRGHADSRPADDRPQP